MENRVLKRIVIFITVFMLVFSNCGYTLQALAATDGFTLFGFNLFGKENLDFDAYFLDENGKKQTDYLLDVNSKMTMVLEVNPRAEGYLKNGTIKAVGKEGKNTNFKFEEVFIDSGDEKKELTIKTPADKTLLQTQLTVNSEDSNEVNNSQTNEEIENKLEKQNTVNNETSNELANIDNNISVKNNNIVDSNTVLKNETITENTVSQQNTVSEKNTTIDDSIIEDSDIENIEEIEEELVDEEVALKEEIESDEPIFVGVAKATVTSENEIVIENIIEDTKIYVSISFKTSEYLNVEDLYKEIELQLTGNYIDINLEEIPIELSNNLNVGWEYKKEFEVSSEYTKVSPFRIGDTQATIVENTIKINRDIIDENYLPLKETKISIEVPNIDGNLPTNLDVKALKLKATTGEDVNEISFSSDNWEYDEKNNILNIFVENKDGKFTYGEDIYVVTYRYETYVEQPELSLNTKGSVAVTEFSGKTNNEIVKNLDKTEKIITNVGELVTYSIGTTEEKISKGKINANYNQSEEKYESEFDTTVSVNILTNDVLNEFILKDNKEFYIDNDGLEFETQDVKYKSIKFKYNEIQSFLEKGGLIEIKNSNEELLYTLNNDLIKSDDDSEIFIQGDVRGIQISFKNIVENGNINIEFTKAIGKSSYEKASFANFKKLESRINAVVKYSEDSQEANLPEIRVQKEFEESKTEADISMNKVSLSTAEVNENVEFKIELNNDKEYSDLYVNPVFEISLPKYVTNIDIKSANMLFESGLSIGNTTIYRADDGTQRMRIEIKGTQTEFSNGTVTNGTNIIINTNITLDKYSPRKDDQIKLYYINEGVTNYVSQTKWTLNTNIPTGIIKTTNGFDSYVFKINAPSGLITINEIQNYDGQNSVVTSIKQGEETREVEMGKTAQVARMNLIAINNTENKCTDVAFLGRIPVKDVTDVKTGEVLETNINTSLISRITENEENPLSAKIYYSTNPNADKNLNDSSNGWTEEVPDFSQIKSFLIIPDNTVEPGYIFKYTYEFVIPENLPYEAKMYGSFGGFYNNHSSIAINYESSNADLVGLLTKAGPKVEAKLSVNVGDGAEVREASFLDYTLTIVNSGSITAENVTVTNPIPEGTTLYEEVENDGFGRYGWFKSEKQEDMTWAIDKLEPGEVKEFKYTLKVKQLSDNQNITEITNKAEVSVSNLILNIESNKTTNKILKSNFDIDIYSNNQKTISTNESFVLAVKVKNISGNDLNNVNFEYKLPNEVVYNSNLTQIESGSITFRNFNYNEEDNILKVDIEEWKKDSVAEIIIRGNVIAGNKQEISNKVSLITEDNEEVVSRELKLNLLGANLEVSQVSSAINNKIKEGEEIEFIFSISNTGNYEAEDVYINSKISEYLENVRVSTSGSVSQVFDSEIGEELSESIHSIPQDDVVNIHVYGKVKDVDDDTKTIISKMSVSNLYQDINTDEISIQILNDPTRKIEPKNDKQEVIKEEFNSELSNNEVSLDNPIQEQENNNEVLNTETQDKSNNEVPNNEIINYNEEKNSVIQSVPKYDISGKIWLDTNKNGILDDEEKGISGVQVQLQKDNVNVKATVSSSDGIYTFKDVNPGKYVIIYSYDGNLYTSTIFRNVENGTERASYSRELTDGQAITDVVTVENGNVESINFGLKEKDRFDLTVSKSIILAKVITNGKTTEHKYKNLDLAKLEISAKDLDKTMIELHYQIVVKNEGNISGKAIQIADYLPKDTTLNLEQSKNWYLGNDGNAYNDSLNELLIAPGEKLTIDLVLNKNMTSENTGVVGNKVVVAKAEGNTDSIIENNKNNDATQELIISIRTGYTAPIFLIFVLIIVSGITIYMVKTEKINLKKFKIKKITLKKFYK